MKKKSQPETGTEGMVSKIEAKPDDDQDQSDKEEVYRMPPPQFPDMDEEASFMAQKRRKRNPMRFRRSLRRGLVRRRHLIDMIADK